MARDKTAPMGNKHILLTELEFPSFSSYLSAYLSLAAMQISDSGGGGGATNGFQVSQVELTFEGFVYSDWPLCRLLGQPLANTIGGVNRIWSVW